MHHIPEVVLPHHVTPIWDPVSGGQSSRSAQQGLHWDPPLPLCIGPVDVAVRSSPRNLNPVLARGMTPPIEQGPEEQGWGRSNCTAIAVDQGIDIGFAQGCAAAAAVVVEYHHRIPGLRYLDRIVALHLLALFARRKVCHIRRSRGKVMNSRQKGRRIHGYEPVTGQNLTRHSGTAAHWRRVTTAQKRVGSRETLRGMEEEYMELVQELTDQLEAGYSLQPLAEQRYQSFVEM